MKPNSLPKTQIVSGKLAVSNLLEKGKGGTAGCLRYKWAPCHTEALKGPSVSHPSRIMVSVPKKSFRRAVKRNLLKRRMREAYRLQKALIGPGLDILFVYVSKAILPFEAIFADMTAALTAIAACNSDQGASCHTEVPSPICHTEVPEGPSVSHRPTTDE